MKTPEEILRNKGFIAMVHDESKNILREAFIDPVIQAMQEYAEAYHIAKMQEVTDEDIEKWASIESQYLDKEGHFDVNYINKRENIIGAKAFRDGKIKHYENDTRTAI